MSAYQQDYTKSTEPSPYQTRWTDGPGTNLLNFGEDPLKAAGPEFFCEVECFCIRNLKTAKPINDVSSWCTCVFLWPHWSIDHPLKGRYPIPLLGLRLTGKQELPVRRYDGDAVVPVVALGGRGQTSQDGVAVLLTADEDLATGVGVLGEQGTRGEKKKTDG